MITCKTYRRDEKLEYIFEVCQVSDHTFVRTRTNCFIKFILDFRVSQPDILENADHSTDDGRFDLETILGTDGVEDTGKEYIGKVTVD